MADVLTTTAAGVNADLQTYFSKKLQRQAQFNSVLDQFGYIEKIPSASSKTISFTKYADLTPTTTALTEGTPPDAVALSSAAITATIDQLGYVIKLTDLAELTPKHPVVQKTLELLGTQAARSRDQKINAVVVAGTGVQYAGGRAARSSLVAGDLLKMSDISTAVATLRNNGATEFADGTFVCVIDPTVEMNLMADSAFRDAAIRNGLGKRSEVYKGELATFNGVRFVRSNNIPTISSTVTVHTSYLFGRDGYAVTDLQTLRTFREGPGGLTDPLHQQMSLGWKVGFKSVILNNSFMQRLESAGV
jgi:N4-gp56 family major capsid protein